MNAPNYSWVFVGGCWRDQVGLLQQVDPAQQVNTATKLRRVIIQGVTKLLLDLIFVVHMLDSLHDQHNDEDSSYASQF